MNIYLKKFLLIIGGYIFLLVVLALDSGDCNTFTDGMGTDC